ncbi:TPA: site-2 protease family protein [Patescibacteria group bacterium]|jgi:Zn-dependent protease|nr:site-2 protease family protein [Patescibacteria group bacterium]|tara:strand:+ start:579 stop:1247 length:669 start_codon:yes stop_codon:yes gene_type:complete
MSPFLIFQLVVLIFSIMIHEIAHGAMALRLGDNTAKRLGRLTLNPLKHLDPVGSVILPLMLILFNSPILIGWAKPVPYNPYNLKDPKKGAALIGAAGPLSNIVIAVTFSIILSFSAVLGISSTLMAAIGVIVLINLLLAIFNLVPIPPLDGSKLLFALFPRSWFKAQMIMERNGFLFLLLFIFLGLRWLWMAVMIVFVALLVVTGVDPNQVLEAMTAIAGRQ